MKLYERLLGREQSTEVRDASGLTMDDLITMFSYDNVAYQLRQSMGTLNEESVPTTANASYRGNGPVFALTLARLQVFSQARFQWTRFTGGKPTDLFGSPELALLERPWPNGTTADLLARMELHATTAGNWYGYRGNGVIHCLNPAWMTIMVGSQTDADHPREAPDATVVGYGYSPPTGSKRIFLPEEIAHYAPIPDPDRLFVGMSWVSAVIRDVRADSAMVEHEWAFLRNAATPNLAIKFDPAVKREDVAEFKKLMEEEHRGFANAYRTLYLGGGADATVIGKDFKEIDLAAVQGKGESRLAAAAGVPPSWVGFSEGLQGSALNAGNFGAARRRFADGTMQHLWMNACSSLESILNPPPGASLWFTTDSVSFMREDATDLAAIQQKQAQTMQSLVWAGYEPASIVDAITNNDFTRLVHTGLYSVQLQPPGPDQGGPQGATP